MITLGANLYLVMTILGFSLEMGNGLGDDEILDEIELEIDVDGEFSIPASNILYPPSSINLLEPSSNNL
jgi:hypothetical protein